MRVSEFLSGVAVGLGGVFLVGETLLDGVVFLGVEGCVVRGDLTGSSWSCFWGVCVGDLVDFSEFSSSLMSSTSRIREESLSSIGRSDSSLS